MLLPLASAALAPWMAWTGSGRAAPGAAAPAQPADPETAGPADGERVEIVLLHDNDQHFHTHCISSVRRTVRHVRESRRNVLHFNAGDIVVRHPHRWAEADSLDYYERMTAAMIDEMNETGYDAMVLGNHEIDYKDEITLRQLRRAEFPIISANAVSETPRFIKPQPSLSFESREGLSIKVLGLSVGGAEGVTVRNRQEVMREHLHLREECDLFVLLTHIGYRADLQLAEQFPEVDLIIGGHSHTLLPETTETEGPIVGQAGGHPHVLGGHINGERPPHLGVVQLVFENRELVLRHGRVFTITEESEAQVQAEIGKWLDRSLAQTAAAPARHALAPLVV